MSKPHSPATTMVAKAMARALTGGSAVGPRAGSFGGSAPGPGPSDTQGL